MITTLINNPILFFSFLVSLVIVISVHEWAHAAVADYLGDPTPRLAGRLTLDPRSHLDPLGLLLLFIVGFGWGKPVPFDPFNLKNPKRDAALISFAGPLTNFIMALLGALIIRLFILFKLSFFTTIGGIFLVQFIYLNLILGVFNLLPFHPLDGFKIVGGFLSDEKAREWYSLERYGIIFLICFILPLFGDRSMLQIFMSPVIAFLTKVLIP